MQDVPTCPPWALKGSTEGLGSGGQGAAVMPQIGREEAARLSAVAQERAELWVQRILATELQCQVSFSSLSGGGMGFLEFLDAHCAFAALHERSTSSGTFGVRGSVRATPTCTGSDRNTGMGSNGDDDDGGRKRDGGVERRMGNELGCAPVRVVGASREGGLGAQGSKARGRWVHGDSYETSGDEALRCEQRQRGHEQNVGEAARWLVLVKGEHFLICTDICVYAESERERSAHKNTHNYMHTYMHFLFKTLFIIETLLVVHK